MSRRLFTVAAAVSLGLCMVAAFAWVRSYLPSDTHAHSTDGRVVVVFTSGELSRQYEQRYVDLENRSYVGVPSFWRSLRAGAHPLWTTGSPPPPRYRRALGVEVFDNAMPGARADYLVVTVP